MTSFQTIGDATNVAKTWSMLYKVLLVEIQNEFSHIQKKRLEH